MKTWIPIMALALMACAEVNEGSSDEIPAEDIESQEFSLIQNFVGNGSAPAGFPIPTWGVPVRGPEISFVATFPACGAAGCATQTNLYSWWTGTGTGSTIWNWTLPTNRPAGSTLTVRLCLLMRSSTPAANPQVDLGCLALPASGGNTVTGGNTDAFVAASNNWGAWGRFGQNYYPVYSFEYVLTGGATGTPVNPIGPSPVIQGSSVMVKYTRNQDLEPSTTGLWNFNHTAGTSAAMSQKAVWYTGDIAFNAVPNINAQAVPYSVPTASCAYPNSSAYYRYTVAPAGINYRWNVGSFPLGLPTSSLQVKLCYKMAPLGSGIPTMNPSTDPCTVVTTTGSGNVGNTTAFNGLAFNKVIGSPHFYFAYIIAGQGTGAITPAITTTGPTSVSVNYTRVGTGSCN